MVERYKNTSTGTIPAGIRILARTVEAASDNSYRLYLACDSGYQLTDYEYMVDSVSSLTDPGLLHSTGSGTYYLTFTGVCSNQLHKMHTFTISDANDTWTMTASVLSYVYSTLKNSSNNNSTEATMVKAIYQYNQAAIACFGE